MTKHNLLEVMKNLRFALHMQKLLFHSHVCLVCFLKGPDFEHILREQPLQLPLKPPQKRAWRGSNNMLVLYNCPANNSSKCFVHALHNEHPIPLPVYYRAK